MEEKVDVPVFYALGVEYQQQPTQEQMKLARW